MCVRCNPWTARGSIVFPSGRSSQERKTGPAKRREPGRLEFLSPDQQRMLVEMVLGR